MKQISIKDMFTKKRKNRSDENHHKRPCSINKQISGEGALVNKSPDRLYNVSSKSEVKENNTVGPLNTYTDSQPNIVYDTQSVSKDESLNTSDQQCISEDYEIDSLSNSGTVGSESLDRSNNDYRKSEVTEKTNVEQTKMGDEPIVCEVDTNNVNEIQPVLKDVSLYISDQHCISEEYEINSLSNSGTMGRESLNWSNDNSQKSEVIEITNNIEQTKMEDEQIVCYVDPNNVNEIQFESPRSQEIGIKKEGLRRSKPPIARYSNSFILHTIQQYGKHLKTSNTFKGILTDESLDLLSTLTLESEDNIKLVSHLFCVDHCEPEGIANEAFPKEASKINYDCSSLNERGLITFSPSDADVLTVEQCLELLKFSQIQEACENIINKTHWKSKKPEKIKREIIEIFSTGDIKKFFNDVTANKNKKSELLTKLRSKVKKWKLSDLAREMIIELSILMHLDNIFKMGCSIDFTQVYNDRPVIKFKPSGNTKPYPVDKDMILDNATIIFHDRKEFCAYLNALALCKKYKTVQNKHEFVLSIYELYKNVNKEMSHYLALPVWLLRFTPINIYAEILADGVEHLKKAKEYEKALKVLDLLITQVAFKQDTKAYWYDRKALIQLKYLNSPEKAASTLFEAFKAGLPEETVMILQRRANHVLKSTSRSLDQKVIDTLKDYAKSEILEENIKTTKKNLYFPSEKKKFSSRTRPRYKWNNEIVLVETLCCNLYKINHQVTLAEHWEGNLMNAIYFMLFWDIIYTKPIAIGGIFLSHYQQYPLDMWCENFYTNRKPRIDDLLIKIENSSKDDIKKIITDRYDEFVKFNLPEMTNNMVNYDNIVIVVDCLGGRRLAAICRRLAHNYNYMRYGFPDLTLCDTENYTIEFREVKTNDTAKENQLQWLHYLNKHDIKAGFCFLSNDKEKDNTQVTSNKSHIDSSHSTKTNDKEMQPEPS